MTYPVDPISALHIVRIWMFNVESSDYWTVLELLEPIEEAIEGFRRLFIRVAHLQLA